MIYNITKLPPKPIMELNNMVLIADKLKNLTKVFLLDIDFDIMWLTVCLYTALDALGLHILHSTLIIYVYYFLFIKFPRGYFGEMILSKTSGVDSRFLI